MNYDFSVNKMPFSSEEISFLQQKKSIAFLFLLGYFSSLVIGLAIYAVSIKDITFAVIYAATIIAIFGFLIFRDVKKISKINLDLAGNFKVVFEAEIEDYKQFDQTNKSGEVIGSDYFLDLRGERYAVQAKDFFKFGRGDLVRVTAAPESKYAFAVEKIRAAEKSFDADTLFRFITP